MASDAAPHVDPGAIEALRRELGPDALRTVVTTFTELADRSVPAMRLAAQQHDWDGLRELALTLRSGCRVLHLDGAEHCTRGVEALGVVASDRSAAWTVHLVDVLEEELILATAAIRAFTAT